MKILIIEDGRLPSRKFRAGEKTLLIGIKLIDMRIENIICEEIDVDGLDATEKAFKIVSKAMPIDLILLSGISYAGFNLIDAEKLWLEFKIPIIVISKDKPNNNEVLSALKKHFSDWKLRWNIIERVLSKSQGIHAIKVKPNENPIYVENIGISVDLAEKILRKLTIWGKTPEPLRIAKIIARGLSQAYLKFKGKL